MRKLIIILSVFTYILPVYPDKEVLKSKNPLPYFRRQVEEIADDIPVERVTEDSRGKLLSLFVKNVKEIFNDIGDDTEQKEYHTMDSNSEIQTIPQLYGSDVDPTIYRFTQDLATTTDDITIAPTTTPTTDTFTATDMITIELRRDNLYLENVTITPLVQEFDDLNTKAEISHIIPIRKNMKETAMERKSFLKSDAVNQEVTTLLTSISSYVLEPTDMVPQDGLNKTCVLCNNILTDNCNDPKNKM